MSDVMGKLAAGLARPVIDTRINLEQLDAGLKRLEDRNVFGKIVVEL
jgi:alcohol dehydrogenase